MSNNKQSGNQVPDVRKMVSSVEFYRQQMLQIFADALTKRIMPDEWELLESKAYEQAEEMYRDELEAAVIKQCAEESTQNASAYAIGYSSGYKRALDLVKWKIDNELTQNNEQQ